MYPKYTPCKKPIDENVNIESAGENPVVNIEISGGWSLRPRRNSNEFLKQIYHFSVFTSLLIVSCYVFIVHKLVYYDTLHTKDLKNTIDHLLVLSEQLQYYIDVVSVDLENLRTEFNNLTSDHVRQRRSLIDPKECKIRKRNRYNCTKTIDNIAVQFKGYNPDAFANRPNEGVLGPWFDGPEVTRAMKSLGLTLKENDRKVEISKAGMYFIYSQVTYLSKRVMNSYSINVISTSNVTGKVTNKAVALCSTVGQSDYEAEISCFTSITRLLYPKDIVYLQQNQRNTTVLFEGDMTYFGLIKLAVRYGEA